MIIIIIVIIIIVIIITGKTVTFKEVDTGTSTLSALLYITFDASLCSIASSFFFMLCKSSLRDLFSAAAFVFPSASWRLRSFTSLLSDMFSTSSFFSASFKSQISLLFFCRDIFIFLFSNWSVSTRSFISPILFISQVTSCNSCFVVSNSDHVFLKWSSLHSSTCAFKLTRLSYHKTSADVS